MSNTELEKRVQSFNEELSSLSEKHKLTLIALPYLVQSKSGGFEIFAKPQLVDTDKAVESNQLSDIN